MSFEYVDFPAIGLRVPVTKTLFRVFGQDIYTYAVIIALSIVLMIFLGLRHGGRYGINKDDIIDFMIFAMPASIICARIYYVIFSWDNYRDNPWAALNIRQGGLAIYGAVIGAFATVFIFSKVRKMDAIRFLDFGVPYLLLAQGIGRWGNFVNQEVFGVNTTLPWGMTGDQIVGYLAANSRRLAAIGVAIDPMAPVHPTFLYESLWNLLVACLLFGLRRRKKYKGEVLIGYLIGYGAGRAFIEGLRTDSLMLGSVRISQLLSVLIVVACLAIMLFFRNRLPRYDAEPSLAAGDAAGGGSGGEKGDGPDEEPNETAGDGTDKEPNDTVGDGPDEEPNDIFDTGQSDARPKNFPDMWQLDEIRHGGAQPDDALVNGEMEPPASGEMEPPASGGTEPSAGGGTERSDG